MAEPLYLDYPSAAGTVQKMQSDVAQMQSTIANIQKGMNSLHDSWRGSGYQKRKDEFETDFNPAMKKMADAAEKFNGMLNQCMAELKNLDEQLAGG